MASASKAQAAKGGGEGGALLNGSCLPKSKNEVTIFINAVREAPEEWTAALVLDIDEEYGCASFAPNKTQTKALIAAIGDETDDWPGHEVTLGRVRVRNPQTNSQTWGFEVLDVKKSKRKPKPPESDGLVSRPRGGRKRANPI